MILASFPSPDRSVWDLGPVPIRAYALCIIAGIVAAVWIGERRWVERGGRRGTVSDISVWAVISGLIGGRLYHVITDNELYFREGRDPWRALYVWEGGLGIWGAIALGGVGAWIACRQRGIALRPFADTVAPAIAVGQSIGRWGNYFNQELFGRPTDLPWAVEIDPGRPSAVEGATTYHPTFLYESLWTMALAVVLIVVDRRYRMGRGRVFALFLMGYTAGRVWIELLRIDTANELFGTRINVWTCIVVFAGALAYFLLNRGPRETGVEPATPGTRPGTAAADPGATATDPEPATAEDAKPATTADPKPGAAGDAKASTTADPEAASGAGAKPAAGDPGAGTGAEAAPDTGEGSAAGADVGGSADADTVGAVKLEPGTGADAGRAPAAGASAGAGSEPTAEEQVASTPTDEPLTVERRRRLLPAGRRKR